MDTFTKTVGSIAALGALALGGSALADAASNTSTQATAGTTTQAAPSNQGPPPGGPQAGPGGRHVGANGKEEQPLSADVAKKVSDAALTRVKGTVERTETDVDHGSPYEAHIRKSDGTEVEVLVNKDFEVTAVNEMGRHP